MLHLDHIKMVIESILAYLAICLTICMLQEEKKTIFSIENLFSRAIKFIKNSKEKFLLLKLTIIS